MGIAKLAMLDGVRNGISMLFILWIPTSTTNLHRQVVTGSWTIDDVGAGEGSVTASGGGFPRRFFEFSRDILEHHRGASYQAVLQAEKAVASVKISASMAT